MERAVMTSLDSFKCAKTLTVGTKTYIYRRLPTGTKGVGSYLSGTPYLFSGFGERAFIFRDAAQAESLIAEFPEDLRDCAVGRFVAA